MTYLDRLLAEPAIKCQCPARDPGAAAYHGGHTDGCHRDALVPRGVVTSPALCAACLHGCMD